MDGTEAYLGKLREYWLQRIAEIDARIAKDPEERRWLLEKGQLLCLFDRYDEARTAFEEFAHLYPEVVAVYIHLSEISSDLRERMEHLDLAQQLLERDDFGYQEVPFLDGVEEYRDWLQHSVSNERCRALLGFGRNADAVDYMKSICNQHPGNTELRKLRDAIIECQWSPDALDRYYDEMFEED